MARKSLVSLFALLAGLAVTMLTGLVDVTPTGLVGATWHGLPLPWFYVMVYPGSPWTIDWMNFAGDLVFWIVVWFVVGFVIFRWATSSKRA